MNRTALGPTPVLSDFELGWLVGMFEGEGSFLINTQKRQRYNKAYSFGNLQVGSVDEDVIDRLQTVLGGWGARHTERKNHPKWQPFHRLRICKQEQVKWLTEQMLPHLNSRRRQQAEAMLAAMTQEVRPLTVEV